MTLSPKKLPEKRTRSPQKPAPHDHSSPHDNLNDEGSESLEFNSFHASRFKVCVFPVLHCTFSIFLVDLTRARLTLCLLPQFRLYHVWSRVLGL